MLRPSPSAGSALIALAAAVFVGVAPVRAQTSAASPAPTPPLDRSNLDTTCAPCRDFYQFANGGWLVRTQLPASYTTYGAFTELQDRNQDVLHGILDNAARDAATTKDANTRKLGLFYASCMDSAGAEAQGTTPIKERLSDVQAIKSLADLQRAIPRLHMSGVTVPYNIGSTQDFADASRVIATITQSGLGLPDRDYYTKTDSTSAAIRAAYVDHIARMFELLGDKPDAAKTEAQQVLAIETALANASLTRVERRNPKAVYHKMSVAALDSLAPNIGIRTALRELGTSGVDSINVGMPDFTRATSGLMSSVPLAEWKQYLRWHVIDDAAPSLSTTFVNEDFRLRQTLSGAKELLPRWKRCLRATDVSMGEILGEAYVKQTFTPEAKARALAMVRNLEAVLHSRLASLEWMSDETRRQASVKLDAFANRIGYPDKWRDYSLLRVDKGPFVLNRYSVAQFATRRDMGKIGKPVDRTEWGMTPPTVNASYSPVLNSITFPAGILQPPFFDPNADDAVNYGGMGAVIGHEMTHGFDDQGRQFDAHGNLRDWWTPADAAEYTRRATLVANQFDGYVGVDTLHVNGKLTLGENIADLGGLTIAYEALERSLEGKPRPAPIDGFTPEQRFFLAWAQVWRRMTRPQTMRQLLITDPHAPANWRVNGPLSNMPAFAKAFSCTASDSMVRPAELRAQIW